MDLIEIKGKINTAICYATEKRKSRESVLNSEMDLMPIFCEV